MLYRFSVIYLEFFGNDFLGRLNLIFWILVLDDVFVCVLVLWEDFIYRLYFDWRFRSGVFYKWFG